MKENGKLTEWQEISCLADRIRLKLPEDYGKSSKEVMALKFPTTPGPQEAYIDQEGNRIFTFNLLDKPLQEWQVYPAIWEIRKMLNHAYPESTRMEPKEIKTDAGRAGWFAFATGGMDDGCVHCMFVLSVDGKMMFGCYHFPDRELEADRRIFVEMLKSIRVEETERQGGGNRA